MFYDYLEIGCAEIINTARASAYAAEYCLPLGCDVCPELPDVLGHDPYTDPVTDNAPWWDPAVPESARVLGVIGLDVAGFRTSPVSRTVVQLVGDGATLGVSRRAHRQMIYTVLLVALDECALSYGLAWLASALEGAGCSTSCTGEEMVTFACCPTGDGSAERRYLYDVGLVEGPTVTAADYLGDEVVVARVTFTLAATKPWIYRDPPTQTTTWLQLAAGEQVTLDPDDLYTQCVEAAACPDDPSCPDPLMPVRPPIPVDPCYPSGPAQMRRTIVAIPPSDMYQWLPSVPVVELETGASAVRRLVVRFRPNLLGGDCTESADPCGVCADIQIPYLPAGSLLRVDGRVRRAEIVCNVAAVASSTTSPVVYGRQGRAFEWPTFDCPSGLCVEILTTAASTAPDARARVFLAARSDAG